MIEWMQRHKKWLVVTIWISTIAFVGAGFVGWGSYNYSQGAGVVAKVGEKEIKFSDLQQEYNLLYNQYQMIYKDIFNDEMAKQIGLEKTALDNIVQKTLLLNLADEYGISATNDDIAKKILGYQEFQKDGKFDKNQYQKILKENRTNSADFEANLAKSVILEKISNVFKINVDQETVKSLTNLFAVEDNISIAIINSKNLDVQFDEEALKAHYDTNKEQYKSLKKYKLNISEVQIHKDNPKDSKTEALKKYLAFKKGELNFEKSLTIDANTQDIPTESLELIFKAKLNDILKPIELKDKYLIVQLKEITEPQILSYDTVKDDVKKSLDAKLREEKLILEQQALLENFNGDNIGFVSLENTKLIDGLSSDETKAFLNQLFTSKNVLGSVKLEGKIVVYHILESRLTENTPNKEIERGVNQILERMVLDNILKNLENTYKITSYVKE